VEREFSIGDRIQFTAPNRQLHVSNRDLGTIQQIDDAGRLSVRMDGANERIVSFNSRETRHFDHGYAVTSHSSQGLTAQRVLVNMDTEAHPELINSRFAYVSISRGSHEAQIYTNNTPTLGERLSHDVTKTPAVDFTKGRTIR
jgi:ATP-dependent exoDNAse (exonuclease V) alpha subunit